jgi:hypothetical protein
MFNKLFELAGMFQRLFQAKTSSIEAAKGQKIVRPPFLRIQRKDPKKPRERSVSYRYSSIFI